MNAVLLGLMSLLLASGCGKSKDSDGDRNSVVPAQRSPDTIQSGTARPQTVKLTDNIPYPCDPSVQGNIVFIKSSGFRVCTNGNTWEPIDLKGNDGIQGPPGLAGPKGGSTLVAVYDSQDRKIGWLTNTDQVDVGWIEVLLTSGSRVQIYPSGYIRKADGNFLSSQCFFASSDCSGPCRVRYPSMIFLGSSDRVNGDNGFSKNVWLSASQDLGSFTANSSGYPGSSVGNGCSSGGASVYTSSFLAGPLVLASGATYPFGPIILRAE